MNNISIDLETYSDQDISSCGVYKYADSPNFRILLFAYSVDGSEVQVVDVGCGEQIPKHVLEALSDPTVTKWAYNAAFERVCLSKFLGLPCGTYLNPKGWKCSMVWGATLGLPLGLGKIGKVLNLEEQKLTVGKKLIKLFCTPDSDGSQVPPGSIPEDWDLFKQYNKRDVETEMAVQKKLSAFPVPEFVWEEYWLDQRINDNGVLIDDALVKGAITIDAEIHERLSAKLTALTGVSNPASVYQLKYYLESRGVKLPDLGKLAVTECLEGESLPTDVKEVLTLRQQFAKSSVKKYQAMARSKCSDGRCRGMFQFYGASRTGRWAGRNIQLQNLPQNHIDDLESARVAIKTADADFLSMCYDSPLDVLSQCIRTAFVARKGTRFVVADFSAIEARVIAWYAREEWRLKVFAEGGDIYCAAASAMFHVPVKKHGINGHLRQKGKVAELACIAEGQLVETDHGLKPIEKVELSDRVWDGENWVKHEGVIFKGYREVINYEGFEATPDHMVFIEGKHRPVRFDYAAASGAHLKKSRAGGQVLRAGRNNLCGEALEQKLESLPGTRTLSDLRNQKVDRAECTDIGALKGLPKVLKTTPGPKVAIQEIISGTTAVLEPEGSGISAVRGQRDKVRVSERYGCGAISNQDLRTSGSQFRARPHRHEQELCTGQPSLCDPQPEQQQQAEHRAVGVGCSILAVCSDGSLSATGARIEPRTNYSAGSTSGKKQTQKLERHSRKTRVYDIRNAGPHHRYAVSGKIVHNCGYGGGVGALTAMGALRMGVPESELQPLVTAWRASSPHIVEFWWAVDRAVRKAIAGVPNSTHALGFHRTGGFLFITLPSGRRLAYPKPSIRDNRIHYWGTAQAWCEVDSYGPKFVENIVQATSRDLLCNAMRQVGDAKIEMHIHDELVIEAEDDVQLEDICKKMAINPSWAEGLLLRADGYETPFYKKD